MGQIISEASGVAPWSRRIILDNNAPATPETFRTLLNRTLLNSTWESPRRCIFTFRKISDTAWELCLWTRSDQPIPKREINITSQQITSMTIAQAREFINLAISL